ncbi:MAG: PilZ domain-containing protein [Pyrinomonadaceae bacterium]
MKNKEESERKRERVMLTLPVRVVCRESLTQEWTEMTRLIDLTPFGARLAIKREIEFGRLLHLTLPMPRQMRCYDYTEDQYRVWVLVRNVKAVVAGEGKPPRYEIGVAFIGKRPPASFETDPTKRYDVASTATESGVWSLREMPTGVPKRQNVDDPRPETRYSIPVEVIVETLDEDGKVTASERTVTENISRRGAAIFTSLNVERGSFVRLTSSQYQLSVIASVRGSRKGADTITRLHLEFVDKRWPLEGIE